MQTSNTGIHPLGQAYLDARGRCYAAYGAYMNEIRKQYGPDSNAFTQSRVGESEAIKESRRGYYAAEAIATKSLLAMRKAGATVHPREEARRFQVWNGEHLVYDCMTYENALEAASKAPGLHVTSTNIEGTSPYLLEEGGAL